MENLAFGIVRAVKVAASCLPAAFVMLGYRTVNDPRPGRKLYPSDHFPVVATLVFGKK